MENIIRPFASNPRNLLWQLALLDRLLFIRFDVMVNVHSQTFPLSPPGLSDSLLSIAHVDLT